MTSHLPECLHDDTIYGLQGLCVCDELRACEQRVLDAAREAVASLLAYVSPMGPLVRVDATLAAIDRLRGADDD